MNLIFLAPVLAWIAVTDLLYRRIANRLVLALLLVWGLGTALSVWQGTFPGWQDLVAGATAAGFVLVIGCVLFSLRWVGAGDVKLMAVLCLWFGDQAIVFLMAASLCGGLLALALPLLSALETRFAHGFMQIFFLLRLPDPPQPVALSEHATPGIPYGIAIALGAGIVLYGS
ncbi:A24 family peptidase [Pseudothauera nasutitermitis]|uniref:A24 family peptidase n=1 Tax=Pseudothauera nasutitermitis TaxID=2565930 RepID=UPI001B3B243C|nr:prepilin peptidase [Pseudothauera nasutitermitis]